MKPTINPLTDKFIKSIKPKDKVIDIPDGNNLYLRVNPTGTKSWLFRYKNIRGKKDIYHIGHYFKNGLYITGIKEAREKRNLLAKLVSEGIDPKEKDKQEQEKKIKQTKEQLTFSKYSLDWIENKKNVSHGRLKKLKGLLVNHINPLIGDIALIDINLINLKEIIEPLEAKGNVDTPRDSLTLIKQVLTEAEEHGYIKHCPNVSTLYKYLTVKPQKNHPHVELKEIPKLLKDISNLQDPRIQKQNLLALKLIIILFIRQGAYRYLKWENIDFQNKTLTIPSENQKGKMVHKLSGVLEQEIPLPSQAIKLLEQLKEITGNNTYLFPSDSRSKSEVISDGTINKVLNRVIDKEKQNVHGFRGLASTWLNENFPTYGDVIEAMLSHKQNTNVRARYNHAQYLELQAKLWQAWGDYLEKNGLKID